MIELLEIEQRDERQQVAISAAILAYRISPQNVPVHQDESSNVPAKDRLACVFLQATDSGHGLS